jgi:hypothetical protein
MNDDAVVLARYLDIRTAEMAVSILEGSEIDAFINVPYTSSMFPHLMLNRGGVAVFVRTDDLESARAVLDSAGEGLVEVFEGPADPVINGDD